MWQQMNQMRSGVLIRGNLDRFMALLDFAENLGKIDALNWLLLLREVNDQGVPYIIQFIIILIIFGQFWMMSLVKLSTWGPDWWVIDL